MKITIRKALPEDDYKYTDCFISCLQTAYRDIMSDDFLNNLAAQKEQQIEKFRKNLENPNLEIYCIILENKMIGFLTIHKTDGEIWAVYLLEEFRSKGYGEEILKFAVEQLKRIGHHKITLWVLALNNGARKFYEKNGFTFDGTKRENANYGKTLVQLRYAVNLN